MEQRVQPQSLLVYPWFASLPNVQVKFFFFGTNDELVLNSNSLEPAIVIYSLVLVLMKQFLHVGTLTHWVTLNYT